MNSASQAVFESDAATDEVCEQLFYARLNDTLRDLPLAQDYSRAFAVASAATSTLRMALSARACQ